MNLYYPSHKSFCVSARLQSPRENPVVPKMIMKSVLVYRASENGKPISLALKRRLRFTPWK